MSVSEQRVEPTTDVDEALAQRLDDPGALVRRPRRLRARARADLRPQLGARRTRAAGGGPRRPRARERRARARRRDPRSRGRAARLRQRLPASRPSGRARRRQPQDAAVPLPRLDVRARRQPARRRRAAAASCSSTATSSAWCRSPIDTWRGFVFVNPDVDAPPLAEANPELDALAAKTNLDFTGLHATATAGRTTSPRTGRSGSRTRPSATTARPCTARASRDAFDTDEDVYELIESGNLLCQFTRYQPTARAPTATAASPA